MYPLLFGSCAPLCFSGYVLQGPQAPPVLGVQLGKPLFEMWCFHLGIVKKALDPPPSVKRANVEKNVPQTILALQSA